jgi:integrase
VPPASCAWTMTSSSLRLRAAARAGRSPCRAGIMTRCHGALILAFARWQDPSRGEGVAMPTVWNHFEGAFALALRKEILLRYVPLTVRLASALREHHHLRGARVLCQENGAPLTQRLVQGWVLRPARSIGLRNVGVHVLRHTFCSHLAMRGGAARAIQELAGHRDLVATQRYMHLVPLRSKARFVC